MVVGETEIFGQVKRAYQIAAQSGTTGRVLNRLFQKAFQVGKHVRSSTAITRGSVSIASVAVALHEAMEKIRPPQPAEVRTGSAPTVAAAPSGLGVDQPELTRTEATENESQIPAEQRESAEIAEAAASPTFGPSPMAVPPPPIASKPAARLLKPQGAHSRRLAGC
jgi:Glutamyl-tRNAGlu reductase, N-terminal domain